MKWTDHEIYYIKIELNPWQTSNNPFSETEQGFGVGSMSRASLCTGVSPTLSWKWPRATPSLLSALSSKDTTLSGENCVRKYLKNVQIMPLCIVSYEKENLRAGRFSELFIVLFHWKSHNSGTSVPNDLIFWLNSPNQNLRNSLFSKTIDFDLYDNYEARLSQLQTSQTKIGGVSLIFDTADFLLHDRFLACDQGLTGSRYPTRPELFFKYPTRPDPKIENDWVPGNWILFEKQ